MADERMVFISYARADGRAYARRLYEELTAHNISAWLDERNLNPYLDFSVELEKNIRRASYVVVCLTPSINENPESFVRREIIYAQSRRTPIIPLVFPNAEVLILINHLTWIPFTQGEPAQLDFASGLQALLKRLADSPRFVAPAVEEDPYGEYLNALYEQIVTFLDTTVFSLIPLHSKGTPDAIAATESPSIPVKIVSAPLTVKEQRVAPPVFTDIAEAFHHYTGRMLLLGAPGAGKSTALWAYARDAVVARLADREQPLPILAQIPSWDSRNAPPLSAWLKDAASIDAQEVIADGNALLLLDGLDELGGRRTAATGSPPADPRAQFMALIPPDIHVLLTCRRDDYADIGKKVALNGAVTLQALNDEQISAYLHEWPALQDAVTTDERLHDIVRTPLLLSLFTFAYANAGEDARKLRTLKDSPGALGDRIFTTYIERRYQHEQNKPNAVLPYTLEEMHEHLSELAVYEATRRMLGATASLQADANELLGEAHETFLEQACRLHLLISTHEQFQFIHLLLRNYFAFTRSLRWLTDTDPMKRLRAVNALGEIGDERAVDPLITAMNSAGSMQTLTLYAGDSRYETSVHDAAMRALGQIGSERALDVIADSLRNMGDGHERRTAAGTFATVADERPLDDDEVDALIDALHDPDWRVQSRAAAALERIGTRKAGEALYAWEQQLLDE